MADSEQYTNIMKVLGRFKEWGIRPDVADMLQTIEDNVTMLEQERAHAEFKYTALKNMETNLAKAVRNEHGQNDSGADRKSDIHKGATGKQ
jgi:hypothetical protein